MIQSIAVAGATGDLGKGVVHALLARGAKYRALVRTTSDTQQVDMLRAAGAAIVVLQNVPKPLVCSLAHPASYPRLRGLRETLSKHSRRLLETAVAAGIPPFIPPGYAADFAKPAPGENRNFDLRCEFHSRLDNEELTKATVHPERGVRRHVADAIFLVLRL